VTLNPFYLHKKEEYGGFSRNFPAPVFTTYLWGNVMIFYRFIALFLVIVMLAGCGGAKARSQAYYKKGCEFERQGKVTEAFDCYKKAIGAYAKNIPAHQRYQDLMTAQGKKDDLVKEYKTLMDENLKDYRYQYLYGRLLDLSQAQEYYRKSIKMHSHFAWGYYGMGLATLAQKKYSDALADFEKASELEPDITDFHLQLGRTYAMVGKLGDAEKEFRRVLEIDKNDADGYFYLGNVSLITGNVNEAFNNYTKALELNPSLTKVRAALGKVSLIRGKYDRAIELFSEVERKEPKNAWSALNLARAYYLSENRAEAMVYFKKALTLNPDLAEAHYLVALAWMDEQKWGDAERELAHVEKLNRKFPGLHKARALIALGKGSVEGADRELSLEDKIVQDPEVYYIRGQIFLRLSKALKAEEQFKQALSIESRYYPAYLGMGQVEEYFHEYIRAIRAYEQAMVLFPDDVEITYRIGVCYSYHGDEKQAAVNFKKAFELGMDDWSRTGNDIALQGLKNMPEVTEILVKYKKTPGSVSKYKHSQLTSTGDLIYNQINRAYRKM
jgi:tetratricopeptide (TPR) repeat protein